MAAEKNDIVSIVEDGKDCRGKVTAADDETCTILFDDKEEGVYGQEEVTIIEKAGKKVMSKKEAEEAADKLRKAKVDEENIKRQKLAEAEEAKLAKVPLTLEERAFIAEMTPKMNNGRQIDQPSPAQIGRYARLLKRKDVK